MSQERPMVDRRFNEEEYSGHFIRVYAESQDAGSGWTIQVDVQAPDGSHHPLMVNFEHSYPILEQAFAAGSEVGRKVVDSGPAH